MTTQNLSLFKALGSKMDFLNQRQLLISQNIANADTPGYKPKDLAPVDFDRIVDHITEKTSGKANVALAITKPGHATGNGNVANPKSKEQSQTYEVSPSGNAVVIEEQLINASRTVGDYNLMTNLYQKHVSMMRMALGGTAQ